MLIFKRKIKVSQVNRLALAFDDAKIENLHTKNTNKKSLLNFFSSVQKNWTSLQLCVTNVEAQVVALQSF